MRLTHTAILASILMAVNILPAAAASKADGCEFSESYAMRSGELPFAGTLDEQVAASMDNIYATSDRFTINNLQRIGGRPGVKIVAHDGGKTVREIYYVNNGNHSYQLTLSAAHADYRKQKQNLRVLLRDPFGEQLHLCK
jgi:hypothetical protein